MIKKLLTVILALFAAAAFAAVDVNKATQADLESIKGIGPMISTKIIDERKKGGPFKDWDDVITRVKGIGNLIIADASIFPSLITTNINCAVMMAAEKAADLVLDSHHGRA